MYMMIMNKVIPVAFKGFMSKMITTDKEFLKKIEKMSIKNENDEIGTLLTTLISMRQNNKDKGKERNKDKETAETNLKENNKRNRVIQFGLI